MPTKPLLAVLIAVALVMPGHALAATLLQSKSFNLYHRDTDTLVSDGKTSIPTLKTGQSREALQFDPFDTRLGVLTGVTLRLASEQQVNGAFSLDGRGAINVAPISFTAMVKLGDGSIVDYWTSGLETNCSSPDFNGCIRVEVARTERNAFWTLGDLSLFTGTGPVEIATESFSSLGVVPFFYNGVARIAGSHGWDGNLVLAYDYSPASIPSAVPEPDVWALMILGVGLAGVALRRRRRAVLSSTT